MAFWGIEVKPGKPYTHRFDEEQGRLHLSQATLGTGSSAKKSIVQCNVGDKGPIYLCSLLPDRFETCQLNLEFEEEDEVTFSVIGPHSIHLSGFFHGQTQDLTRDDYGFDSYEEDIGETESDESIDYDTEDEDEDLNMFPPSSVPNSGVVIEEIVDEEKPAIENDKSNQEKNGNQLSISDNKKKSESDTGDLILETEDEDGFPIASPHKNNSGALIVKGKREEITDERTDEEVKKKKSRKKKAKDDPGCLRSLKRKVDDIVEDGEQTRETGQQPDSSFANTEAVPETEMKQEGKKKKKKARGEEEKTHDAGTDGRTDIQSEAATMGMEQAMPVGKESNQKLTAEQETGQQPDSSFANTEAVPETEMKQEGKKKKKKARGEEEKTHDAGTDGRTDIQSEAATMDMEQAMPVGKESNQKLTAEQETGQQPDSSFANTEAVPETEMKQEGKKKKKKARGEEEKTHDAGTDGRTDIQSEAATTDMEQAMPVGKESNQKLTAEQETGQQPDSSFANTEAVPETEMKQEGKKKKKKASGEEEKTHDAGTDGRTDIQSEAATLDMEQAMLVGKESNQKLTAEQNLNIGGESIVEGKKKKIGRKSKKKGRDADANVDQTVSDKNGSIKEIEETTETKPFQVRSFPNGLVVEELAMGKPDGKKASPGRQVFTHYIGKLKNNGRIFDSNIGRAPFKFRLGVGQVIRGWDVGINGMRVGDKRRLTIPPAMGYGAQGAGGGAIPPNSWLVFDVELVDVR